jgi:hypothetical protein
MSEPVESSKRDVKNHVSHIVIFIVLLTAPFFFSVTDNDRGIRVFGYSPPELCYSKNLFKISCPGCGLTRSFIHLAHFEIASSFRLNRCGILVYILLLVHLGLHLRMAASERPLSPSVNRLRTVSPVVVAVLLCLNWIINLITGKLV